MKTFLICGNAADINAIDFPLVKKDITVCGVNRINNNVIPDYWFIYDLCEIMPEIGETDQKIWTEYHKALQFKQSYYSNVNLAPVRFAGYGNQGNIGRKKLTMAKSAICYLVLLINKLFPGDKTLLFAGCPMIKSKGYAMDRTGGATQKTLNRIYNGLMYILYKIGVRAGSLMNESLLNDFLPVYDKSVLYGDLPDVPEVDRARIRSICGG